FYHPEGTNLDQTAILDGVTIRDGNTVNSTMAIYGGGMYNEKSSPTLNNVRISHNYGSRGGGGIYNKESNPTLMNVEIIENRSGHGGGIYNENSSPILTNVKIHRNIAFSDNRGGGGLIN